MVTNNQTNKQPGDPGASLLLTTEKAVFSYKRMCMEAFSPGPDEERGKVFT